MDIVDVNKQSKADEIKLLLEHHFGSAFKFHPAFFQKFVDLIEGSGSEKKLINQFLENKYYKLVISDYAGNTFDVEFNVNSIANTTTIQNSNNLENAENEDDIKKKAALILLDCLTKFGQWCSGNTN